MWNLFTVRTASAAADTCLCTGNRITPSYVAFTEEERLVGDAAKNQAAANPHNTIFDIKRLIGRKFSEKDVQSDIKHFPYK